MATTLGWKYLNWDLTKGAYATTDSLPLMHSPGPVCMIVAVYFLFILKLGPAYMRKREAYKLTNVMLAYNVIQVIFSAYLAQRFISDIWLWGLTPKKCLIADKRETDKIVFGVWLYCMAKVSELLDTVFFVLRKKDSQLSFLHLYHHSIMVLATWALLKYAPTHVVAFTGAINSSVHVVMYTYYALAGLGPSMTKYLWWKKYITTFQLVQFISIFCHYVIMVQVSDCPPSKVLAFFYGSNVMFFFVLFANFYKKTFKTNKKEDRRREDSLPEKIDKLL